ncbi:MAG: thermonuclease family protein [Burkholderiales bacterium]|jgi:endonuclease YncB( thermonuclease family)|nr:thermonuclease family protein [Burkholderiales bacterium]
MTRIALAALAALLAIFAAALPVGASAAAANWTRLTDCRYVDGESNDGDSFHVRCGAGDFIVRLYFVDAPETTLQYPERAREQADHFRITLDASLRAGEQASAAVRGALRQPFLVWTRWASAQGRSRLPRYYAFVEVSRHDLAEWLVSRGLARTKGATAQHPLGEPSRSRWRRLQALEAEARQQRLGAWATSGEPRRR